MAAVSAFAPEGARGPGAGHARQPSTPASPSVCATLVERLRLPGRRTGGLPGHGASGRLRASGWRRPRRRGDTGKGHGEGDGSSTPNLDISARHGWRLDRGVQILLSERHRSRRLGGRIAAWTGPADGRLAAGRPLDRRPGARRRGRGRAHRRGRAEARGLLALDLSGDRAARYPWAPGCSSAPAPRSSGRASR